MGKLLVTNLGLNNLQSKPFHYIFFCLLLCALSIKAQNSVVDSLVQDSLSTKEKEPLLLEKVNYKAKDYVRINRAENKLYLYDEAELYYQDIELRAGIIVLDYKTNEVYAGRIVKDSVLVQNPYFIQGGNQVNPDSIRFNFDTQKALIWNSKSGQNGMDIFARITKKENDSVYYIKDARVTTAGKLLGDEQEGIDYYFKIRKGKIIPGGKIITGFTNMFIADIPTPVALPFAYFPSAKAKPTGQSGFIFPSVGESNVRGYYIQNGGYYLSFSEFFDFRFTGDYYTNGSYGFQSSSQYYKRYKFKGNINIRYENLIQEERGLPGYGKSTVFNVRWSHSKDTKSSPNSNFSASVNFGSSDYYQRSINQLNAANFLNNNLSSSISYQKVFPEYPRVNISLTTALSQNSQSKQVNLTLPTLQANMERIFPFAPKNGPKKGIIQNINFQYTARAENRIITTEEDLFSSEMFKNSNGGVQHTIPISTNFKILKYISVSANGNYNEIWTPKTIKFQNYTPEAGRAVKDTLSGFDAFRQYNYGLSVGFTLYGTVNFKEDKKIQSIRHTLRPSVTYSTRPSFEKYYDTYIVDAEGNTAEYTRFQGGLFGTPSKAYSNSMGISIANNFEAKVVDKDTAATDLKKIVLLNNLNISTSHNFAADSLKWSPVRMGTGMSFLDSKLSINVAGTFDPYTLNENNVRINKYHITNGGGLLRLTSGNVNLNYSFSNEDFNDQENEEVIEENTSGGGRDDDLFGQPTNFSDQRMSNQEPAETKTYPSYRTKIPWNLKLAYSLTYNNSRGQKDFSNNSLMVSGNFELTPKWKVGASSGYDFKGKGVTYTQFRFDRDLKSWRLNFSWVPFSDRASWNFFIGIKSDLLSDIKYEKQREPDLNR